MNSNLINPNEFNDDFANFNEKQISEFERIRNISFSFDGYEKNIELYDNLSGVYEKDLNIDIYRGPEILASFCNIYVSDKNAKILDVGAGTGLVGEFLNKNGFKNLDALEPSNGMLAKLKLKRIYNNIYFEGIKQNQQTSLISSSYDVILTCGTIGEGYLPIETISELLRITKPNGYVLLMMPEVYWDVTFDFDSKLNNFIQNLFDDNLAAKILDLVVPRYYFWKKGRVLIFKKTKKDQLNPAE